MLSDGSFEGAHGVDAAARMLVEVLDGRTYDSVAQDFGVTRTTVEQRVKLFAVRLAREVGIEGLSADSANFVGRLRSHRAAVRDALLRFDPRSSASVERPRALPAEEIVRAANRIRGRSPQPRRDVALFYLLFVTGARPLEIARLEVRDYLNADGTVRLQSEVRAEVSVCRRARPLYFSSSRLGEVMETYLDERRVLGHGCGAEVDRYRGLEPDSGLFLSWDGSPLVIKRYGPDERRVLCREILQAYRKIFRWADLDGLSPMAARHTLVARLYDRGADEDHIGEVLGIGDRGRVREMFPRCRPRLTQLMVELI